MTALAGLYRSTSLHHQQDDHQLADSGAAPPRAEDTPDVEEMQRRDSQTSLPLPSPQRQVANEITVPDGSSVAAPGRLSDFTSLTSPGEDDGRHRIDTDQTSLDSSLLPSSPLPVAALPTHSFAIEDVSPLKKRGGTPAALTLRKRVFWPRYIPMSRGV